MAPNPLILPEIQWRWRRIFTFGRTVISSALLGFIICQLASAPVSAANPLMWLGLAILATMNIDGVLYMAGATATDIARLTAAARSGQSPPGDHP